VNGQPTPTVLFRRSLSAECVRVIAGMLCAVRLSVRTPSIVRYVVLAKMFCGILKLKCPAFLCCLRLLSIFIAGSP
jgi:hypothetical protein